MIAGECDVAPYPNPADIAMLKTNPDVTLLEQAGLNIGYMGYNTTIAPLDKPEVRHALNQAIDRESLIKALFQDAGATPADNLIPPTMWSWNKDVKVDAYDPEAAKKVLADAGLKEIQLWASDRVRPYNPNFQRAAELIQADWAKVGVTATIVNYEWTKYREEGKKKDRPGAFQIGWTGDNGDPDNFFATLFSCSAIGVSNYSSWCDKEFEDLIQKAKTTSEHGRAHQALRAGAGGVPEAGAGLPAGPLAGLHGRAQECQRLHDGPARHPSLRRRRQGRID